MSRAPLAGLLAAVLAAASSLGWAADHRASDAPQAPSPIPSLSAPLSPDVPAAAVLPAGEAPAAAGAEAAGDARALEAAPSALAPEAAPARAGASAAAAVQRTRPQDASADEEGDRPDVAGAKLFDGAAERAVIPAETAPPSWWGRLLAPLDRRRRDEVSPAGAPAFDEATTRQLRSLSSLDARDADDLMSWLRRTKIPVSGRLPYPEDTTFSLELEFLVNRQIGDAELAALPRRYALTPEEREHWRAERYLPERVWKKLQPRVVKRVKAELPKGWRIENMGGRTLGNTYEIRTGNRGGVYHENTARDWDDLAAALDGVQRALPGGLYSVHLHVGRRSLPLDPTGYGAGELRLDRHRFADVAVMFEGIWRPLMGHDLMAAPDHSRLPRAAAIKDLIRRHDDWDFNVPSFGEWLNRSSEFPTMENKSITQLLARGPEAPAHLDAAGLRRQLWPAFALFDMLFRAQRLPLAGLGLPVAAGTAPTRKQVLRFLDLAYGDDVAGKAVALQRLAGALEAPKQPLSEEAASREKALHDHYRKEGLEVIYRLHRAHDGWDEDLVGHLLAHHGRLLDELARDLARTGIAEKAALELVPEALREPLRTSLRASRVQRKRAAMREPLAQAAAA